MLAHQDSGHLVHIQNFYQPTRYVVFEHATVIEDGDGAIGVAPGVVSVAGSGASTHLEVALLASEPPYELTATAVDLVDGEGIAGGGDEQVGVVIYLYGIDVEVVKGPPASSGKAL